MRSAFEGIKNRGTSVGCDKSASIMSFFDWHNKNPRRCFSFCAKKLIYEGLPTVRRLCYRCAFYSVLCIICVAAVRSHCVIKKITCAGCALRL